MNQQGSAEWIQERLGRFTASEIHKLIPSGKGGNKSAKQGKTYIPKSWSNWKPDSRIRDLRTGVGLGYRTRTNGP